ncbi:MAG: PAS domain-containing sensor histidine kinase [Chitinophagaceae bacterium]
MPASLLNISAVKKPGGNNSYKGMPITEIITNGFFTVDRKWTVKYWNKAAEELLGVKSGDIVGKNLWSEFAGILPLDFYLVYHKAFLQDIPVHFEEYWGEMGAWFNVITYHCDDSLSVSFKSSNQPVRPAYSSRPDHPAQQLKILTELYRLVTEVTNDCLWEWDLKTLEIFWIDGGHKRAFGYNIENALIPQNFWESRLHPDDKAGVLTRLNKIISEGIECVWEDEYRFKKVNGDYAYVHDRGHIIFDADYKACRMIGATQDITEKVLLANSLVEERVAKQREITKAVLTALENERATIGRELHDNLGQVLAVAKLYMQMAKRFENNRDTYLDKSCELIVNVIEDVRKISKSLVIPDTTIIGLFDNVKNLLHDLSITHPINIRFQNGGIEERNIDAKLQVTIFRIIQEQLNNILTHSKATVATINLSSRGNEALLVISDNGTGCDILEEKNGVGIINIRSRADLYNGTVTIRSKPGEGYVLKVTLSLDVLS